MYPSIPHPAHTMPFGRHKGKPLDRVPADYLAWALRTCKLSSGLRAAVARDLRRRGHEPPSAPVPLPTVPRPCARCGCGQRRFAWMTCADGARRIRAECVRCRTFLTFVAHVEPFLEAANAAAACS